MITTTQMYWLTRLDYFHTFFIVSYWACFAFIGLALLGFIASLDSHSYTDMRMRKIIQYFVIPPILIMGLLLLLGAALIPTTKEAAAIVIVPRIVNHEKVQEAGNKLYGLAIEWMEELSPRKKEGGDK